MKSLVFLFSLFILPLISFSQKEQPEAIAETMSNIFNLSGDKLTGTCFMVIKDGKQFFITAAHLFESSHRSGDVVPVQMVVQNQLQSFNANIYYHTNRKVDIAVIKLSEKVSQNIELPEELTKQKEFFKRLHVGNGISTDSIFTTPGMDVFFFGFPLEGLGNEIYGLKLPLVKKAVISGWINHNGVNLLLLDGHNNLGFSGEPVAVYDPTTKKMCIVGVISGYFPEPINVKQKKETLSVNANSGIIICYLTRYIEDIFATNRNYLR